MVSQEETLSQCKSVECNTFLIEVYGKLCSLSFMLNDLHLNGKTLLFANNTILMNRGMDVMMTLSVGRETLD